MRALAPALMRSLLLSTFCAFEVLSGMASSRVVEIGVAAFQGRLAKLYAR
jgi:hypothetical protein